MAVDLDKILARQDYVRMTKSLRERCDAVEDAISSKMVDLDICGEHSSIVVNDMRIFCICGCLYIRTPEAEWDSFAEYRSVNSEKDDEKQWVDQDIHMHFVRVPCSNKHALEFLNNAAAIIKELGKIERKKVEAIGQAIEATKDL